MSRKWYCKRMAGDNEYGVYRENRNYHFKAAYFGDLEEDFFENPQALAETTKEIITRGKTIIQTLGKDDFMFQLVPAHLLGGIAQ